MGDHMNDPQHLSGKLAVPGFGEVEGACVLSPCGRYRYELIRRWAEGGPLAVFVLLNPSTADHLANDATARRGMGFAKAWGMNGMVFLNLYAYRATKPQDLFEQERALPGAGVGPLNDEFLRCWAVGAEAVGSPMVCAWGAHGVGNRADAVVKMLLDRKAKLSYLRRTKSGAPEHLLYLPADLKPKPWG